MPLPAFRSQYSQASEPVRTAVSESRQRWQDVLAHLAEEEVTLAARPIRQVPSARSEDILAYIEALRDRLSREGPQPLDNPFLAETDRALREPRRGLRADTLIVDDPIREPAKPLSGKAFDRLVLRHEDFQKLAAMSPAAVHEWAVQMAARATPPMEKV